VCFSPQADLASAALIAPVGVLALRAARSRRELPLASLPALFALHQAIEAVVWLGLRGHVGAGVQQAAALTYLLFAQVVLPVLVPAAFLLLERDPHRRRAIAGLTAAGVAVGAYLLSTIVLHPVGVLAADHVVVYVTRTQLDGLLAVVYVTAVCGPALLSSDGTLRLFGVVNLAGVLLAALVRYEAVTSVWCTYAALASVLVWLALRGVARPPWTPPASPSSSTRRPATSTSSPTP
jgi:hypothetical protein